MSDMLRLTGTVKGVDHKSGSSPSTDRETGEVTQRPWAFAIYRVLVADLDFVEFTVFDSGKDTPQFKVGQDLDVVVKVDQRKGRVQVEYLQEWPQAAAPLRSAARAS